MHPYQIHSLSWFLGGSGEVQAWSLSHVSYHSLLMSLALIHPPPFQPGFCIFRPPSPSPAQRCSKKKTQKSPYIWKSVSFAPPTEMQDSDIEQCTHSGPAPKSSGRTQEQHRRGPELLERVIFMHSRNSIILIQTGTRTGQAGGRSSQLSVHCPPAHGRKLKFFFSETAQQ